MLMRDIKIGYVVNGNIEDKTLWSGTIYNLAQIISKKYVIEALNINTRLIDKIFKLKKIIKK
jgi:hypothetical protein